MIFNQSTKAASAAIAEVVDSAGASADGDMLTRGLRSLAASIEHFNNGAGVGAKWDFLRTEPFAVQVYGPFVVSGVSASAGQTSAQFPTAQGALLKVDDFLIGSGIGVGTRITAVNGSSAVGLSSAFSTALPAGSQHFNITVNRDFYDVSGDWKAPYSARLLGSQKTLRYANRRQYDRGLGDEFGPTTTPGYYDLFVVGGRGKLRILPPPNVDDTLQLRYYRRMTIPSATADATLLDVPQDYEPYFIAWAKWHFLVDKTEGRGEQGAMWLAMAKEGIKTMLKDQTTNPDEDLMFIPGAAVGGYPFGPNSVTPWLYRDDNW